MSGGVYNRLTFEQSETIRFLRGEGEGYRAIATRLGISESTVKGFCRRNDLAGVASWQPRSTCLKCGSPIVQPKKGHEKKFCSDNCRLSWWHEHPYLMKKKAAYTLTCAGCGKDFESYGNKNRKYCCHACYVKARYGAATYDGGSA